MNMPESIIGPYRPFLKNILTQVKQAGFELDDFVQLDHMCYRTISLENYNQKKSALMDCATLLTETQVNGRPIATLRLHKPICYEGWRIDCIELPAPKTGDKHSEGLEHIEFVLYDPIEVFLNKYPNKHFELRSADRGINPEVGYKLNGCSVKFHCLSLQTVTYLEKKLNIRSVSDTQ